MNAPIHHLTGVLNHAIMLPTEHTLKYTQTFLKSLILEIILAQAQQKEIQLFERFVELILINNNMKEQVLQVTPSDRNIIITGKHLQAFLAHYDIIHY